MASQARESNARRDADARNERPDRGTRRDDDAHSQREDEPSRDRRGGEENSGGGGEGGSGDGNSSKPTIFQNPWLKIILIVAILLIALGGLLWWLNARNYESTDDAFIDTHIVHVSSQIAGQVIRIAVNDNQEIRKGQLLVEINSSDENAKLAQSQAQAAQAEMQYRQAIATEAGAAAQAQNAERSLARYRLLQRISPAAVAQEQIDAAIAAEKNANAQRDAARAQIAGAQAQINVYNAQISTSQINLGYTRIMAPVDGHVAQRTVATGNYVSPGQELLAIVPHSLWVTANFKETQLARMRVGQKVRVAVDACGDADIEGHVDSIQRGAGQAFGILPPENATGNYVKVVQRVPVKIVLDRVPPDCILGPGMSVEPSVRVR